MKMQIKKYLVMFVCLLALTACEGTKKQLGLSRHAPDEFAVMKRAPLAMPPDFALRPPRPGAPRPQEMAVDSQAAKAVFGRDDEKLTSVTKSESALLNQAGADQARSDIRRIVDSETVLEDDKDKPVSEKLLGWAGGKKDNQSGVVVDAKAEAERLRANREAGKPVTEGETPVIDE